MSRQIMKADGYNPTTGVVDASLVKLVTAEGDITEAIVPDSGVLLGLPQVQMPRTPQYIMGPNPIDPGAQDMCYEIKQGLHPATHIDNDPNLVLQAEHYGPEILPEHQAYCPVCKGGRAHKGFILNVPDDWPFNAVVQCQSCYQLQFVFLKRKAAEDV